ncbi:MAG: hypothetical protein Q8Q09_23825 [Deltaproteobacteria bacterium]|nr:hypothetical protein [Deltaproteobacteria bacterium]
MATLSPCPSCARHARAGEACPFCATLVPAVDAPRVVTARLHRAAMVGLGAAVALVSACSPSPAPAYGAPPQDAVAPQDATSDTGPQDSGGPAPAYGAPITNDL